MALNEVDVKNTIDGHGSSALKQNESVRRRNIRIIISYLKPIQVDQMIVVESVLSKFERA